MAEMAQRIDAISKHLGQTLKYANECEHVNTFYCVHMRARCYSTNFKLFCCCRCCSSPCVCLIYLRMHFHTIFLLILFYCHTQRPNKALFFSKKKKKSTEKHSSGKKHAHQIYRQNINDINSNNNKIQTIYSYIHWFELDGS